MICRIIFGLWQVVLRLNDSLNRGKTVRKFNNLLLRRVRAVGEILRQQRQNRGVSMGGRDIGGRAGFKQSSQLNSFEHPATKVIPVISRKKISIWVKFFNALVFRGDYFL
jgi:hypothetical protein